jgi:hypothetical protein
VLTAGRAPARDRGRASAPPQDLERPGRLPAGDDGFAPDLSAAEEENAVPDSVAVRGEAAGETGWPPGGPVSQPQEADR